ncbi:MAG: TolC family protein, partial [Cyanobacteriota bacterium]|nr:TolC family protein [Cyanobacteriota bacterium]
MRRLTAASCLVAGVLAAGGLPVSGQESGDASTPNDNSALIDQGTLPNAIEQKGPRPKADPSALPPAATVLPEDLNDLGSPPSLALPDRPEQVRIRELRPITLEQS